MNSLSDTPNAAASRPFQFRLRTLFVLISSIGVMLATNCLGLVGLHYPRAVENNPLRSPIRVTAVNADNLTLEDGRTLRVVWPLTEDIVKAVNESGQMVEIEQFDGSETVHVHVKERGWICGTPWAQNLVSIPLIPDDVPINRRVFLASATVVSGPSTAKPLTQR